jgi:hypothetical protein
MRPEAIFAPVGALALWTGGVLLLTGYRRVRSVLAGQTPRDAFKVGESAEVSPALAVLNRNFMNLLEMPVLFYVVCIAVYVTGMVSPAVLVLAWAFVLLRLIHSLIHLTSNRVVQRLVAFAASNFLLLAIWIWFLYQLF